MAVDGNEPDTYEKLGKLHIKHTLELFESNPQLFKLCMENYKSKDNIEPLSVVRRQMEMIVDGVLSIVIGDNPRTLETLCFAYCLEENITTQFVV